MSRDGSCVAVKSQISCALFIKVSALLPLQTCTILSVTALISNLTLSLAGPLIFLLTEARLPLGNPIIVTDYLIDLIAGKLQFAANNDDAEYII